MLNKSFLKSVVLLAGLISVHANASFIQNGSFEQAAAGTSLTFGGGIDGQPSLAFDNLAGMGVGASWAVFSGLPGWTHVTGYGPGVEVHYKDTLPNKLNAFDSDAADGDYYLEMDTHFNYGSAGNSNTGMFQLVNGLKIGQTYELSFWYRSRDMTSDTNGLNVYWKANGSVIDKTNADYKYDYNQADNNHANWVHYKQIVIATSTEMLIGFGAFGEKMRTYPNATGGGDGKGALLDMVSLVQVSAPGTFALFGLAGLALLARRRNA